MNNHHSQWDFNPFLQLTGIAVGPAILLIGFAITMQMLG